MASDDSSSGIPTSVPMACRLAPLEPVEANSEVGWPSLSGASNRFREYVTLDIIVRPLVLMVMVYRNVHLGRGFGRHEGGT